jgi:hypothetical protein
MKNIFFVSKTRCNRLERFFKVEEHIFVVLRVNVKQTNVKRTNVEQMNVEFYNIEQTNVQRPHVEFLQHQTPERRMRLTSNVFYNTGPDSPLLGPWFSP